MKISSISEKVIAFRWPIILFVAAVTILLGFQIRNLSIDPIYLPQTQSLIKDLSIQEAEEFTDSLLNCGTVAETSAIIANRYYSAKLNE